MNRSELETEFRTLCNEELFNVVHHFDNEGEFCWIGPDQICLPSESPAWQHTVEELLDLLGKALGVDKEVKP